MFKIVAVHTSGSTVVAERKTFRRMIARLEAQGYSVKLYARAIRSNGVMYWKAV